MGLKFNKSQDGKLRCTVNVKVRLTAEQVLAIKEYGRLKGKGRSERCVKEYVEANTFFDPHSEVHEIIEKILAKGKK